MNSATGTPSLESRITVITRVRVTILPTDHPRNGIIDHQYPRPTPHIIHNNPIRNEQSQKAQEPQHVHKDQDINGDEVFLLKDTIRVRRKVRTIPIERYKKLQIILAPAVVEQQMHMTYNNRRPSRKMPRRITTMATDKYSQQRHEIQDAPNQYRHDRRGAERKAFMTFERLHDVCQLVDKGYLRSHIGMSKNKRKCIILLGGRGGKQGYIR